MSKLNQAVSAVDRNRPQPSTLWNRFFKGPTARRHEALWKQYQPLVQHLAERFSDKMGGSFELSELVDAGNVGLLDAIAAYAPDASARFESIAVPTIRQAIARSLTVQRSKEKGHVLRLELADAIVQPNDIQRSIPRRGAMLRLNTAKRRANS